MKTYIIAILLAFKSCTGVDLQHRSVRAEPQDAILFDMKTGKGWYYHDGKWKSFDSFRKEKPQVIEVFIDAFHSPVPHAQTNRMLYYFNPYLYNNIIM